QGAALAVVVDAGSTAMSIGLRYGVPHEVFVSKFVNMRFEPAGMTDDPDIRMATSVMDYIFRRLALDYLPYEERAALGIFSAAERAAQQRGEDPAALQETVEALAQSAPIEKAPVGEATVTEKQEKAAQQEQQRKGLTLESHQ